MNIDALLKKIQLDNQKIILVCLLFVIVAYIDYAFLIKMQVSNIRAVKPKVAKLKGDIGVYNKYLEDSKNVGQKQKAPYLRMLSNDQVPLLLEEISNMARSNNVLLMQVSQVKETRKKEDRKAQQKAQKQKQEQPDNLIPIYIALDLSGKYHDFGKFINDLENSDKFIAVQDMAIKQQLADASSQTANILIKTYVKKKE